MSRAGCMVISLDFELLWGVLDHVTINSYGERIIGAKKAVPKMLDIFSKYDIHATWGVCALIANKSVLECMDSTPKKLPTYSNGKLCSYNYLKRLEAIEGAGKYLFARGLLKKIL